MALQPPSLPQAENNVISGVLINQHGGVLVRVMSYQAAAYGDIVRLYWGGSLIDLQTVPVVALFPMLFTIPANVLTNGTFSVAYSVEDVAGNVSYSPVEMITLYGHAPINLSVMLEVINNYSLANGIENNIVEFHVRTNAGGFSARIANEPFTFVTTPGVLLRQQTGTTDQNGNVRVMLASSYLLQAWVSGNSVNQTDRGAYTDIVFRPNYLFRINTSPFEGASDLYQVQITLINNTTNQPAIGQVINVRGMDNDYFSSSSTDGEGKAIFFIDWNVNPDTAWMSFLVQMASNSQVYSNFSVNFRPR